MEIVPPLFDNMSQPYMFEYSSCVILEGFPLILCSKSFLIYIWANGFSGVLHISPVLGRTVSGSTFRWYLSHLLLYIFLLILRLAARRDLKKMTEMPSKRRSGNRPSQDRTDTRDTRETIALFYNCENIRRYIYTMHILKPNEQKINN